MIFVVWSELGFLGFVWDFWDFVGGCLGVRVGCGGGWGVLLAPPPRALAPALARREGEGVLLVVDGGFSLVVGVWGSGVVFVLGSLSFCEGRFASFAALGPFTNGPYEMAVFLRGAVVVGGVLLAPRLPGHLPLLSGVLGFACSRLLSAAEGAG